jgi:hypothetical protein
MLNHNNLRDKHLSSLGYYFVNRALSPLTAATPTLESDFKKFVNDV